MAIAGVIRGDDMELVGQGWDEVAEHMRGCREPVQEQDRGGVFWSRFPIEDVEAVNPDGAVGYLDGVESHGRSPSEGNKGERPTRRRQAVINSRRSDGEGWGDGEVDGRPGGRC